MRPYTVRLSYVVTIAMLVVSDVKAAELRRESESNSRPTKNASDIRTIRDINNPAPGPKLKLTGKLIHTLQKHTKDVWRAEFHPSDDGIVSCGEDDQIVFWDGKTGQVVNVIKQGHTPHALAFDKTGNYLATVSMTPWGPAFCGEVVFRNLGMNSVKKFGSERAWCFQTCAVHPSATLFAAGGNDRSVRVWQHRVRTVLNQRNGQRVLVDDYAEIPPPPAMTADVWTLAFHPQAFVLAVGTRAGDVQMFTVTPAKVVPSSIKLEGHKKFVTSVVFSPDGDLLASSSHDDSVTLWDADSGKMIQSIPTKGKFPEFIAFRRDGKVFATGQADGTVKLWETKSGLHLLTLTGHTGGVMSVSFHHSGKYLASASRDYTVKVWSLDEEKVINKRPATVNATMNPGQVSRP